MNRGSIHRPAFDFSYSRLIGCFDCRLLADPYDSRRSRDYYAGGEGECRGELELQIAELGIGDRVFLPGHTDEPLRVLQNADCFVLPSVSHESCPAVLAQAMACGLPLVTSDFGPLAEINRNEKTGIIAPMRDVDGLCDAIRRIIRDEDFRSMAGQNGYAFAHNHLSIASMVHKTELLYDSIWNKAGGTK